MAGPQESPGLRDQWRVPNEPRGSGRDRDQDRVYGRGIDHERGRNRNRGKFKQGGFNRRSRSPPSTRRGPPSSHGSTRHRGPSPHHPSIPRGPRPSDRRPSVSSSRSLLTEREVKRPHEASDKPSRLSPERRSDITEPFPKRKRSRSRSPQESHRDRYRDSRNSGHNSRGRPSHRGKHSRKERFQDHLSKNHSNRRRKPNKFGPCREDELESTPHFFNSHPSPSAERRDSQPELDFRRSTSRDSIHEGRFERGQSRFSGRSASSRRSRSISPSQGLKMNHGRSSQSAVEASKGSISPPRIISTFGSDNPNNTLDGEDRMQDSFSSRVFDKQVNQREHLSRPRLDTRQYSSPQFGASNSSYHGSPQSGSPHSSGRGGWHSQRGSSGQHRSRSPQYRQNTYSSQNPPQGPSHQNQNPNSSMPSSRSGSPQRGGFSRSGFQDRRFSNHGSQAYSGPASHRGRGHFNNLQWVASGPRDRGGHHNSPGSHTFSGSNTPQHQPQVEDNPLAGPDEYQVIPKPSNDTQVEDPPSKHGSENGDIQKMPPPPRQSTTPAKEGGKFSFAFKTKATPAPATKPVPDLAQRMQVREPPRAPAPSPRAPEPSPRNRLSVPPAPKFKHDSRQDRRDRDREFHRGRGRDDRRDFRDRNPRDSRRDDRRFNPRDDRRGDDHRPDFKQDRRRDRSPEPKRHKKMVKRLMPRQTLPEEYRDSDSVYFRKPGNESVIGAGTYGKVFKAIHIYTQGKVALKKIRMEGEKDGFPVTAIREIKLLQHLRHDNIVSLLEVMVEKNECFMVFEYLAHDLTGLINHPSFTLTESHKKDLAKQMFEGLQYLHHRGVLHRDIKAANILISNRGQLKYADFGLARFFSKSRQLDYTNRVITIWYRPPELLLGDTRYGPAVDVWSAACVFVEMFSKKAVFPGDGREISQIDKLYSILGTPTRAEWPGIVDMPWVELLGPTERKKRVFDDIYKDLLSPAALDLVSKIFQYDPAKRPTAEEVLAHDYFVAEEPGPQQAIELENIQGDWHEFESKALRKGKDREARKEKEKEKEKEKRKASTAAASQEDEREAKRPRQEVDDAENR